MDLAVGGPLPLAGEGEPRESVVGVGKPHALTLGVPHGWSAAR